MFQTTRELRGDAPVAVIGAGIAGAWQTLLFAKAGHAVTLHERDDDAMTQATSHWAGGMLAPWCEAEVSEPLITGSAFARWRCGANMSPIRLSTARWWWRIRATAPISSVLRA